MATQELVYKPNAEKQKQTATILAMQGNPRQAVLLAYIAGIMDGEGTIRLQKNKVKANWNFTYHAQLSMGMVTEEIPNLLKETLGGNVREERVLNRRSIWRWTLTGRFQIIAILEALLPYLRVKKPQAELALEFCRNWKNATRHHHVWLVDEKEIQRREDAYQAMRKLNVVGAAATTKRVGTREGEAIVWTNGKPLEGNPKSFPRQD